MSFGIPIKAFPMSIDGKLKFTNHKKWVERREKKETYLAANPFGEIGVDIPSHSDILLGRGSPYVSFFFRKSDICFTNFSFLLPSSCLH